MTKHEQTQIDALKKEIKELREVVDEIQDLLRSLSILATAVKWVVGVGAGIVAIFKFSR